MKNFLLLILRIYKFGISPILGVNCRFYPNCSDYAVEAISKYGIWKGGILSSKRFCKCQPWHSGGIDFVSPIVTSSTIIIDDCSHP